VFRLKVCVGDTMRGAKRAYFSLIQLYEQLYKEGHI
jgi:hypothetical protein